jgi:hypothetical protein
VGTKTAESLRAASKQQVKLMVRVAQLRKTMSEARQVAEAADRNYAFAEEAGSRATELALWAALSGYHVSVCKLRQTIKAQGDSPGPFDIEWPVRAKQQAGSALCFTF